MDVIFVFWIFSCQMLLRLLVLYVLRPVFSQWYASHLLNLNTIILYCRPRCDVFNFCRNLNTTPLHSARCSYSSNEWWRRTWPGRGDRVQAGRQQWSWCQWRLQRAGSDRDSGHWLHREDSGTRHRALRPAGISALVLLTWLQGDETKSFFI